MNCTKGTCRVVGNPDFVGEPMITLSYSCELAQTLYLRNKSYWGIEVLNQEYLVNHPAYKESICAEGCSCKLRKQ